MDQRKKGMMIVPIIILVFIVVVAGSVFGKYNSAVAAQEKVQSAFADIDTQLQRRMDLIPNLINTVKGYMEHEEGIIEAITESREKLMGASSMEAKAEANEELTTALNNLNVVVENYPDLKASTNFIQLQDELAGTENRIATARRDYNNVVQGYNKLIKQFPMVLFASSMGFEPAEYFNADEGSKEVPNVEF